MRRVGIAVKFSFSIPKNCYKEMLGNNAAERFPILGCASKAFNISLETSYGVSEGTALLL